MPLLGGILMGIGAITKGAGIVVCFIPGAQAIGGLMIAGGHCTLVTGAIVAATAP